MEPGLRKKRPWRVWEVGALVAALGVFLIVGVAPRLAASMEGDLKARLKSANRPGEIVLDLDIEYDGLYECGGAQVTAATLNGSPALTSLPYFLGEIAARRPKSLPLRFSSSVGKPGETAQLVLGTRWNTLTNQGERREVIRFKLP